MPLMPGEMMRAALLSVLPAASPGLTVAEAGPLPLLPEALFPGGDKAGWWLKAAQLDLEAQGIVRREASKPLRLHRARERVQPGHSRPQPSPQ